MNQHLEKIINILQQKTKINDVNFLSIMANYKLAQMSSNMRAMVELPDGTKIPTNMYAINFAPSGFSKGKTINILEDEVFGLFKERFIEYASSKVDNELSKEIERVSISKSIDIDEATQMVMKEWNGLPKYLYSFSTATIEGLKAKRRKLHVMNIGATSMEVDEIASNLDSNVDILGTLLETYDMGKAKQKLIKFDSNEDVGNVPSNLLMFGTPHRILDGGKLEDTFVGKLREGYARRCLFGYVDNSNIVDTSISPEDELKDMMSNIGKTKVISNDLSSYFESLVDLANDGCIMSIDEDAMLENIKYRQQCELNVKEISIHKDIEQFEMAHRYWKALKLSGTYAFVNKQESVSKQDMLDAIEMVELSGKAFNKIMNRPSVYKRLAHYIVESGKRLTQYELVEDLPFFNGTKAKKEELLTLATAYAYTENMVLKRTFGEGVEFFEGTQLEETSDDKVILSISNNMTEGYDNRIGEWKNLYKALCSNICYSAHHFQDGYRTSAKALLDSNLIILDVDEGIDIKSAMSLLSDYKYLIATTKSHQKEKNGNIADRFRIILMADKIVSLKTDEYNQFMANVMESLPFEVDKACKDIARFYYGTDGAEYHYNNGNKFPIMEYLPNTQKNENRIKKEEEYGNFDGVERFFALRMTSGQRNNMMIRFALFFKDKGYSYEDIEDKVLAFNNKMKEPMSEKELFSTILKTIKRKVE